MTDTPATHTNDEPRPPSVLDVYDETVPADEEQAQPEQPLVNWNEEAIDFLEKLSSNLRESIEAQRAPYGPAYQALAGIFAGVTAHPEYVSHLVLGFAMGTLAQHILLVPDSEVTPELMKDLAFNQTYAFLLLLAQAASADAEQAEGTDEAPSEA